MPRTEVRETRSVSMCPESRTRTPAVSSPRSAVQGIPPMAISTWLPAIASPAGSVTATPSSARRAASARARERAVTPRRPGPPRDAAAADALLGPVGGLRLGAGPRLVSRGDQGALAAQGPVRARELGTGHAGAADDQVLGQGVQLVQLGPVQDPLAVAGGAVQLPGASPDREQDHVRLEALDPPPVAGEHRSEERRVGKECRTRESPQSSYEQKTAT